MIGLQEPQKLIIPKNLEMPPYMKKNVSPNEARNIKDFVLLQIQFLKINEYNKEECTYLIQYALDYITITLKQHIDLNKLEEIKRTLEVIVDYLYYRNYTKNYNDDISKKQLLSFLLLYRFLDKDMSFIQSLLPKN